MNPKEIIHVLLATIVMAFAVSFSKISQDSFSYEFLLAGLFFLVIFIFSIGAKKLTASYLQSDTETKIWQFQRYGLYERSYFKKPIPLGVLLPFFLAILTLGRFPWLATTQTEITASKSRVAKRHGLYRFSEMTDSDIAWITGAGIFIPLVLAIIAYFAAIPNLSRLCILFSSFNMIPLGNLDGTKIFFGSRILWTVLAVLCLIGIGYLFLLV